MKELSALSELSCADALETNCILYVSIVIRLRSYVFDENYHEKSRPLRLLSCMLAVFQKNSQHFQDFQVESKAQNFFEGQIILRDANS